MPPRTAYSPVSRTPSDRRKPLVSSQAARAAVEPELPGAAEKLSRATLSRGGTRCRMALTVVDRMRGRSAEERERASRDRTSMRRAAMAALGDTRS